MTPLVVTLASAPTVLALLILFGALAGTAVYLSHISQISPVDAS